MEVSEFLKAGFYHILDWDGLDHILFIAGLSIAYSRKEMGKFLLLLTAFTVGHAVTLGLTVSGYQLLESRFIEFLIPVSIVAVGIYQLTHLNERSRNNVFIYIVTILFGMIHGMGYASTFKSMFSDGQKLLEPLLQFNIGVEVGQLIVAFVVFKAGRLIKRVTDINHHTYKAFLAGLVVAAGLFLMWENRFWVH